MNVSERALKIMRLANPNVEGGKFSQADIISEFKGENEINKSRVESRRKKAVPNFDEYMKENYEPIISCETMTSLTTPGKILQDVKDYSKFSQKNHQANKLCNVPVGETDMERIQGNEKNHLSPSKESSFYENVEVLLVEPQGTPEQKLAQCLKESSLKISPNVSNPAQIFPERTERSEKKCKKVLQVNTSENVMGEHDDSVYIFDENSHEIPFDPDFRDMSELFTDLQDVFVPLEEPLTRHSSTDDEQVNDSDDVQNQATSENFLVFEAVNQDDTTAELMETREYLLETNNCEEVPPEDIAVDSVNEKNHEQPPPPLQVTEVTKKSRAWNRTNACPYCRPFILITNFTRHLKRNHAGEDEVLDLARIVAESDSKEDLKIRKKRRTELTEKLRLKANYAYNVAVMNKEVEGSLLPVRRSNCTDSVMNEENHATCAYCQGLFARNTLYLHVPICKMNTSKDLNTSGTKRRVLRTSAIMLTAGPKEASEKLKELVFPRLQHGEVSLIAKSDPLIVQFASRMIKKHFEKGKINYIKNCMRDLARFFIEMKKIDSNLKNLEACFQVEQYNNVILTIQCMCGINYDTNKVSSPSVAARLKGAVSKCIDIIYCNALMDQTDHVAIKSELDQFMHLLTTNWQYEISGRTNRAQKQNKMHKEEVLPDSQDILDACLKIEKHEVDLSRELMRNPCNLVYKNLTKLVIAHLIILGRKRPGEVCCAEVKDFNNRRSADKESNEEYIQVLSEEERKSYDALLSFHIIGKGTEPVCVILTRKMDDLIRLLIRYREKVGIDPENPLLFPKPDSELLYDGSKCIDYVKDLCKLRKPVHFNAIGLRHHMATKVQLMNKGEQFTEQVARQLGHSVNVHKKNYRLPLSVIQRGIVGHEMLKMTGGTSIASASTGESKTQESDQINQCDVNSANLNENVETSETVNVSCVSASKSDSESSESDDDIVKIKERFRTRKEKTKKTSQENQTLNHSLPTETFTHYSSESELSNFSEELEVQSNIKTLKKMRSKTNSLSKVKRTPWTHEEKIAVFRHLSPCIIAGSVVRQTDILKALKEEALRNRTVAQVRTYLNNIKTRKVAFPAEYLNHYL